MQAKKSYRVLVPDTVAWSSVLSLQAILMMYGIDPQRPYQRIDKPEYCAHLYIQERTPIASLGLLRDDARSGICNEADT